MPDAVVQRQGQTAEIPLQLRDEINAGDVIRTLRNGRVQIELLDGTSLNVGVHSAMRIVSQDAAAQETQVELTDGLLRAEVSKLTLPDASFEVRTMTAKVSTTGGVLLVHALTNLTEVNCLQGSCSIQNIDPSIPGQVTLSDGQSTTVPGGLAPTAAVKAPAAQSQGETKQTEVRTPPVSTPSPESTSPGTAKAPWHIGSLSEGASLLLLIGIGGGVAAAAAVAASSGHGSSSTASPSAP